MGRFDENEILGDPARYPVLPESWTEALAREKDLGSKTLADDRNRLIGGLGQLLDFSVDLGTAGSVQKTLAHDLGRVPLALVAAPPLRFGVEIQVSENDRNAWTKKTIAFALNVPTGLSGTENQRLLLI